MIYIDMPKALEALRKAVEERGEDYVDRDAVIEGGGGCVYVRNGQPSCIVGTALAIAGVPAGDMNYPRLGVIGLVGRLSGRGIAGFSSGATGVLREAQLAQDSGKPWGDALAAAKEWSFL